MSTLKASRCDTCGNVQALEAGDTTAPRGWYTLFGPEGHKDFCTRGCAAVFFRPTVANSLAGVAEHER